MAAKPYTGIETNLENLGYGKAKPGDWASKDFLSLIAPGVRSGLEYGSQLEGARQSNINNALSIMSPGNIQAQTKRGVGELLNMGQTQGDQEAQRLAAEGYGKEYQSAVRQTSQGQAQRQANQLQATEGERLNQAYINAMQIIQQGQSNPLFAQATELIKILENQRINWGQINAGKSNAAGSAVAGVAGSVIGGLM